MNYKMKITETLVRVVDVEAESEQQAWEMVQDMYNNEDIVLDSYDFYAVKIDRVD
jgi:hypothetical protein